MVLVAEARKGAPHHLIDEPIRRIELRDARREPLPDAEMGRLPGHFVTTPEWAGCHARDRPLAGGGGRALMEVDIASQIEQSEGGAATRVRRTMTRMAASRA